MGAIIPSFLSDGRDNTTYTGSAFNSIRLLLGEVQERIETNDPRNLNKIVPEYRVWCTFYEHNTSVARMVENVIGPDLFGSGVADTFTYTLRGANSATRADGNNKLGYGLGSKVLLLAILGMRNNYVILSGIRNSKSTPDDPTLGHHMDLDFNGIQANINNDGELTVTYGGATQIDGNNRDDVDQEAVGTTIQITKDGSLTILDKDAKESIKINRPDGKVEISASTEIDVSADSVQLGTAPTTPAVLGNPLVSILNQLCVQLQALTANLAVLTVIVTLPTLPSTPPVNAPAIVAVGTAIGAIQAQINTILSEAVSLQ